MSKLPIKHKRVFSLLLVGLLLFVLAPTVGAVEIFDESTVIIEAGEVIEDDLMVFANELIMDGTVKGDLITFANKAYINGTVEGDLMGGGQLIKINGRLADDVRLAGLNIVIGPAAQIGDDAFFAAYSLETMPGSLFEGDLFYAGGQSRLAGDIDGDLWVSAGGLELLGNVAGNVDVEVGDAAQKPVFSPTAFMPDQPEIPNFDWGLTIGDQAQIGGDLAYTSPVVVDVPSEVVAGEVSFEEIVLTEAKPEEVSTSNTAVNWLSRELREFVVLLLIGILIVWLLPFWSKTVSGFVQSKPWPSLGWGFVALAAFGVAFGVLLALTILLTAFLNWLTLGSLATATVSVGIFLMFALGITFVLTVTFLTKILVSMTLGRALLQRFSSNPDVSAYWALLLGVFLIVLFTAIPWIGPIISLLVMLFGLGALWQEGFKGWQHRLDWRTREPESDVKVKPA